MNCNVERYKHAFSPIKVKSVIFSNRFIGTPMVNIPTHILLSSTDYGSCSLYDRSMGNLGGITLEYHGKARNGDNQYEANGGDPLNDKYSLDVVREELTVAKQGGALVSMAVGVGCFYEGKQYTPSGTDFGRPIEVRKTHEITEPIMYKLIDECANKARNAKNFGFDYLVVDMSGDNLCAHFMAPGFNKRTDQWGGSYENRFRFAKLALAKIREAVGPDFVIELKVSCELAVKESYSFDDMLRFLKENEDVIDIVDASFGMDEFHDGSVYAMPVFFMPHKQNAEYAKKIKEHTNLKVALVGSINSASQAEELIANHYTDFVILGRSMIADPYWIAKIIDGKEEDIVPCLRCNNCIHTASKHKYVACSVNPRYRRENRVPLKLEKTSAPKTVVVIGAGAAGAKAALTADEKGHHVILIDNQSEVGGMLNVASKGVYKSDLKRYTDYLRTQVSKSNIRFMSNTVADKALVESLHPDVIIIAIGAEANRPEIEGADATRCVQAIDLIKHDFMTEAHNITILGGGSVGCELALDLAHYGKQVSIVELSSTLAASSNSMYRDSLMHALESHKDRIDVLLNTKCVSIQEDAITIETNGTKRSLEQDLVVFATGFHNDLAKIETFYNITPRTYYVGDCRAVANVMEATNDAYFIAASIM